MDIIRDRDINPSVHVVVEISDIRGAPRGSHITTLGPKYRLYSYVTWTRWVSTLATTYQVPPSLKGKRFECREPRGTSKAALHLWGTRVSRCKYIHSIPTLGPKVRKYHSTHTALFGSLEL